MLQPNAEISSCAAVAASTAGQCSPSLIGDGVGCETGGYNGVYLLTPTMWR